MPGWLEQRVLGAAGRVVVIVVVVVVIVLLAYFCYKTDGGRDGNTDGEFECEYADWESG